MWENVALYKSDTYQNVIIVQKFSSNVSLNTGKWKMHYTLFLQTPLSMANM